MSSLKTRWGKRIAVVMAFGLTVASVPGADAQAAKKAKLSTKKLTITVGKKKTIKIKNKAKKAKYTFKSKKASIAKVSKKGVVTARKAGKTNITVSEKKGKKTRKLGTVKVTVKKNSVAPKTSTAPAVTTSTAPSTSTAPNTSAAPNASGAPNTSAAPSVVPSEQPPKRTQTPKPPKTPTPVPTDKPTPTADAYTPAGNGWQRLDLSQWSGDASDYLESGGQIVLSDIELATVPLPKSLENIGEKIEVLVRGSLPAESEGFRFWLSNATGATVTNQYYYTSSSVGIGAEAGNTEAFKKGESFQLQTILEHTNHDGSDDMVGVNLLLKAYTYGASLDGTIITGIWVRYGDDIGGGAGVETPGVETPGSETSDIGGPTDPGSNVGWNADKTEYSVKLDADSVKGEGGATTQFNEDGSVTLEYNSQYPGVWFNIPGDVQGEFSSIEFTYKDATEGGFGHAVQYTDSSADEEIAWGGKFAAGDGLQKYAAELQKKGSSVAKFKIFKNDAESCFLTITSVVLKK